ncbi:MAG: hypothetical protein WCY64_03275 [Candidatus Cloacimonadaceae bacterium]
MGIIDGVVLALAHICGKRLAVIFTKSVSLFFFPFGDKFIYPGVGASGVIRRIAKGDDIFIFADGKAFYLAELGVFQFFPQELSEMLSTGSFTFKFLSQAGDGTFWFCIQIY